VNAGIITSVAQATRDGLALRSFIQLSSVAVYGACVHPSTGTTFDKPRAEGGYGRDKLEAERVAARAFQKTSTRLYVVRLGHVYGPYQGHSKAMIGEAESPTFALPFEGSRLSNAIRINHLAATLAEACEGTLAAGTFNATDTQDATWREVVGWHTEALGMRSASLLPSQESEELRTQLLKASRIPRLLRAVSSVGRAAGQAAVREFLISSAVRDLGHEVLVRAPIRLETYVKHLYTLVSARLQVQSLIDRPQWQIGPWYFSEAVPGPNLCALVRAAPLLDETELRRELQEWVAKGVARIPPQD
jgi:hypothetical protein